MYRNGLKQGSLINESGVTGIGELGVNGAYREKAASNTVDAQ